ncbi:WD40-repeat-containing domain protein [Scleroderma yunnanense]
MSSDDERAFEGPDAYLEDDDVFELEDDDVPAQRGSNTTISQILRSLFDMQQLQPNESAQRTTRSEGTDRGLVELETLTYRDILGLFRRSRSARDDDDDDDDFTPGHYSSTPWYEQWFSPHEDPQPEGLELLMSGEFGRIVSHLKMNKRNRNISRTLLDRSSRGIGIQREELVGDLVPNSNGTAVASHSANLYVGQFSRDSSFYYTCSQDFRLHVYDMTAPRLKCPRRRRRLTRPPASEWDDSDRDKETTLKVLKTIQGHPGRWTITDSHLSPDNERIIYSSITPTVYMASTLDSSSIQTPIHFADQPRRQARTLWSHYDEDAFGIWSCRFSADGNEVIAGGTGHIFVYDLVADRRTVKIVAHADDVNSCCWADTSSGNVLVSASDDTFLRVWDRRSLGASPKPSGVLVGHTEGITNVSAKGDGRYIISNGKDQALRLWDLRKMCSNDDFAEFSDRDFRSPDYDYRYGHYPKPRHHAHPNDCSVMTYRGHAVLRTLIRCNFSPAETTGGKYIYSGSADGKVHIWSLDGRIVEILDRSRTLPMSCEPSGPEPDPLMGSRSTICVRDVSWSSTEPVLMSVGWEASHVGGSVVARHEWKGLSKMSHSLEDWTEKQRVEGRSQRATRRKRSQWFQPDNGGFGVKPLYYHNSMLVERLTCVYINHKQSSMASNVQLFGFPPGYFVIRSLATGRLWDVSGDGVEDGTEVVLWPEKEHSLVESLRNPDANNQVFFIDTSGALCCRASGHAIDVEDVERLVLRHRRPISKPYPNAYSHPLPQFSYDPRTREISVTFSSNPAYPSAGSPSGAWRRRTYVMSAIPMQKPRSLVDNASSFISSAVAAPFSFLSITKPPMNPKATPEDVFSGDIDLTGDDVLEQDRGEEGEVDDSPELSRKLRVLAILPEGSQPEGSNARKRRQWEVLALRTTAAHRRG